MYQVSNVVAVAKLLNVTMVIPYFRESIVWKDSRYTSLNTVKLLTKHLEMTWRICILDPLDLNMLSRKLISEMGCIFLIFVCDSQFHEIYDIKHFIAYFKDDVRIVQHLPLQYAWSVPEYYQYQCLERPNCLAFIPKHSTMAWYLANVPPILGRYVVILHICLSLLIWFYIVIFQPQ